MEPLASYRRASLRAGSPSRVRALRAPACGVLDRDHRSGWMVIMQSPLATAALGSQSLLTAHTRNSWRSRAGRWRSRSQASLPQNRRLSSHPRTGSCLTRAWYDSRPPTRRW